MFMGYPQICLKRVNFDFTNYEKLQILNLTKTAWNKNCIIKHKDVDKKEEKFQEGEKFYK